MANTSSVMANRLTEKCPSCQSWNWCGRQCGRAPKETVKLPEPTTDQKKYLESVREATDQPVDVNKVIGTYQYRDAEKRRAYMRDYMRKKRNEHT